MNTDIRIAIGLSTHHKTIKLMRRCGDRSFYCLIRLWSWAAQYRPDGDLSGMDDEAIEIASDWQGDVGSFVTQLSSVGFIDGNSGCYQLHDWCHHNPWACKAEDRSDSGRLNKLAVKFPRQVEKLKENGVKGVTKSEYRSYIERWETESITSKPQGDPKPTPSQPLTPAPTPTPTPNSITTTARESGDAFVMDKGWKPSEYFTTLAVTAGIVPPEGEDLERAIQEFVPYWMTKKRLCTAHEWDLAFIKSIKSGFANPRNGPKKLDGGSSPLQPRSVREALIVQGEQIAQVLNDDDRKRQQLGPDDSKAGGVLLEHQV